jgi:CheY-like chemotaxis protein
MERAVLELDGFEVVTARTGMEAIKALRNMPRPQLILVDVRMPDMSGPDFIARVEQQSPELIRDVPVVFISGGDEIPLSRGVGFIRKPVGMGNFLDTVHYFIDRQKSTSPLN